MNAERYLVVAVDILYSGIFAWLGWTVARSWPLGPVLLPLAVVLLLMMGATLTFLFKLTVEAFSKP